MSRLYLIVLATAASAYLMILAVTICCYYLKVLAGAAFLRSEGLGRTLSIFQRMAGIVKFILVTPEGNLR